MVVFELIQAMKFKTTIPDSNIVLIIQLILQDSGGTLGVNNLMEGLPHEVFDPPSQHGTSAGECMRSHLQDSLEFIADVHTIAKIKVSKFIFRSCIGNDPNLFVSRRVRILLG